MITIDLKTITLDGVEYDVEFQESRVAVLLMSPVQDIRIDVCVLMQEGISANRYINDFGDEDYEDSAISDYLCAHLEEWLIGNWSKNIEHKTLHA